MESCLFLGRACMRRELFGGDLYKANLHTHTTVSDGKMTPAEIKSAYLEMGYSIVAFTDHDLIVPHGELRDESFLPITGCEIALEEPSVGSKKGRRRAYHFNLYAKEEQRTEFAVFSADDVTLPHMWDYVPEKMREQRFPREYSVEGANALITRTNADGFLVSYNHPVWSLHSFEDYGALRGLWGVELYNSAAWQMGYLDTPRPLEDLLRRGSRPFPIAADDVHRSGHCFGGWVTVASPSLEYGAVMRALERGDFYASSGPEIFEISFEDGILTVLSSPIVAAYLTTERRYTKARVCRRNAVVQEMKFDLSSYLSDSEGEEERAYFRLTLRDARGNFAWSRAYFADELTE